MYIIYHSSDGFGCVTATSIVSLLSNNQDVDDIHILLIEKEMTDKTKERIQDIIDEYHRSIEFINMPNWADKLGISLQSCKSGWLGFGYNRLFVTDLVPENIDRVLYLDSDTIIEQNLSPLWNIDFEDCYLAGVDDCLSQRYNKIVEISETATYCNAGVLMLNLKKWREDHLKQKFIDYIVERNGYFVFNEQTIINSVCPNKIKVLPCSFNTTTLVNTFEYSELIRLRAPRAYSYCKEEYYAARKKPVIIHYTGCFYVERRPWIANSDHPLAAEFDKYYKMTSWRDEPYQKEKRVSIGKRICHILPKSLMISLVHFVYTDLRVKFIRIQLKRKRGYKM